MIALFSAVGGILVGIIALTVIRIVDSSRVNHVWRALKTDADPAERFDPAMTEQLPTLARQYLNHAITPGAQLAERIELRMSGAIKTGEGKGWAPMKASQIITRGRGFVWKASIRLMGPLRLRGADYYFERQGKVRFALFGIVPLVGASGPDVDRSAAGRAIIESIWLPTAFLPQRGARWESGADGRARVTIAVDWMPATLTMSLGDDGRLLEVETMRYQGGQDGKTEPAPFGVAIEGEREFGGFTIPSKLRGGWWYNTEDYNEFIRIEVEDARFY